MAEGVSLREALTLAPLQRARVVAGAAGLDRLVNQINIMEVPDILPWVKPGQLLLTTAYPLRDERAALAELVPGLATRGLAGFAIKPSRYIDEIPQVMVDAAERLAFPLIELPPEASFDEVINAVLGSILNAQAMRLERSAAIHDRFTRIVLGGGGLREIAQTLTDLIERPSAIVDPEGTVLATSAGASAYGLGAAGQRGALMDDRTSPRRNPAVLTDARTGPSWDSSLPTAPNPLSRLVTRGAPTDEVAPSVGDGEAATIGHRVGLARFLVGGETEAPHTRTAQVEGPALAGVLVAVQPIQVDGEQHGSIVVVAQDEGRVRGGDQRPQSELGEDALVAVEQAATVAALRLVQARGLAEADRRFQAVCLEELVAGQVVDRGVLHERALAFGWDLSTPRAVLVAELTDLDGRRFSRRAGTPEDGRAWHRLAEAFTSALGRGAIVWQRSAGVAALVAPGRRGRDALLEAAASLQTEAARRLPGTVVAVGIGRASADPFELAASHREALRALAVGGRTRGPGHVSLFEDLGLDRLLAGCSDGELAAFCEGALGKLLAYDDTHGTELARTLDAFLACSGNGAKAAQSLFVHYNTLRHRLGVIEQVLGISLDDAEARLSLGLALRLRRMLPR
jgi:purine catabolism regulator